MTNFKRKRENGPKFYAVRIGKQPGVYTNWDDCFLQVKGFANATFKSFPSQQAAEDFVQGINEFGSNSKPTKWYGVRAGRKPGVYGNWPEAQEQIVGWKAPQYKAFATKLLAEQWVDGHDEAAAREVKGSSSTPDAADASGPTTKKARTGKSSKASNVMGSANGDDLNGEHAPGEAPLAADVEDDFDKAIALDNTTGELVYKTATQLARTKYVASTPRPNAPVKIYTDGSSLANGTASAVGGIGVYFGPRDARNISEVLPGSRQTNQRAELNAILRALEVAPRDRKAIIFTDSNYAIKCVNEWFQRWRSNGWTNTAGKPVENRDLVQKVIDLLEERCKAESAAEAEVPRTTKNWWNRGPSGVEFVWVKGHAKDEGNIAADELAVAAARDAKELLSADLGE